MKQKLLEYIKLGLGFYIGYNVARALDERLGSMIEKHKSNKED